MASRVYETAVYSIRCIPTGAVYIGSTRHLSRRWWDHRHDLEAGKHFNPLLQQAWAEHGPEAFSFGVLARPPAEQLVSEERRYLAEARARGEVLNRCTPRRTGGPHNRLEGIDWSSIDWAKKGDRLIARELGCSTIPVARRRPPDAPSPGCGSPYLSRVATERLGRLSPTQRLARGRALTARRSPAGEARRVAAVQRARSVAPKLAGVDWTQSIRVIAQQRGVSKWAVSKYRALALGGQ